MTIPRRSCEKVSKVGRACGMGEAFEIWRQTKIHHIFTFHSLMVVSRRSLSCNLNYCENMIGLHWTTYRFVGSLNSRRWNSDQFGGIRSFATADFQITQHSTHVSENSKLKYHSRLQDIVHHIL